MPFQNIKNVNIERDQDGVARQLEHVQEPFVAQPSVGFEFGGEPSPRAVAEDYLRQVAPIYGINEQMLASRESDFASLDSSRQSGARIVLAEEKPVTGTTTLSYVQTYQGIPVWEAGINVTVQELPTRVTSSQSSVHLDVATEAPALGITSEEERFGPEQIDEQSLPDLLGEPDREIQQINEKRLFYYRYDPEDRFDPELRVSDEDALQHRPPTLPLLPVPVTIIPGTHYKVTEVLFTLSNEGGGAINWSALVEVRTGAVLRLRALVACAARGTIFRFDPVTLTGNSSITPGAAESVLDPLREIVNLEGLRPPLNSTDRQRLDGEFVRLLDVGPPAVAAPAEPLPGVFSYPVRTDNFAAVNAYHHCDALFRTMQGMGFNVQSYFDGTEFPVRVDHRALGINVNAEAPGNATRTGSDGFRFALAAAGQPVGIAADYRVVLHEFGHTLLWDNVHWPNFGFAHSAGDSLAAILSDPDSRATDRFLTFPWITAIRQRRHDRAITAGWAWGGINDLGSYESEQILSTTLFRLYRAIGGDDLHRNVKTAGARYTAYLIIKAIGLLGSGTITPTPRPDIYATKLMEADIGTRNFEGRVGGALHKVIRWSFEKQGLYQPTGAPEPVTREGAPPAVDVYINDGREGQYEFKENVWNTTDIWNRVAPDGGTDPQSAIAGVANFAYVRVKNRGTRRADNVIVRGYTAMLATGLVWPGDWQPMATRDLSVPSGIASGGSVVVGPFRWIAPISGQAAILMSVSASGDLSNIDPNAFLPCAAGPTPEWLLVPFDNNLARRNVAVVTNGLLSDSFDDVQFEVKNPFPKDVQVELKAMLPEALAVHNWTLRFDNPGGSSFVLGPGQSRSIFPALVAGNPEVAAGDGTVEFLTYIDDTLAGVVTYDLSRNIQPASDSFVAHRLERKALSSLTSLLNLAPAQIKSMTLKRISVDIELSE